MSFDRPIQLGCGDTQLALRPYQTALIPAAARYRKVRSGESEAPFLFVTLERSPDELQTQLLTAGLSAARIDKFTSQFPKRSVARSTTP